MVMIANGIGEYPNIIDSTYVLALNINNKSHYNEY